MTVDVVLMLLAEDAVVLYFAADDAEMLIELFSRNSRQENKS
jgi:hypothetical protein